MPEHKLLIVDDEVSLLKLMSEYLGRLGYQVSTAADGKSAVKIACAETPPFAVIVLDLTLPDMRGQDVLSAMLECNSTIRVLVCSGDLWSTEAVPKPERRRVSFLQKPFLPKMLAGELTKLLAH